MFDVLFIFFLNFFITFDLQQGQSEARITPMLYACGREVAQRERQKITKKIKWKGFLKSFTLFYNLSACGTRFAAWSNTLSSMRPFITQ